jgi:hypothetical protein
LNIKQTVPYDVGKTGKTKTDPGLEQAQQCGRSWFRTGTTMWQVLV